MTTILAIKSSANGERSASNKLIEDLVELLRSAKDDLTLIERDLDAVPIEHVTSQTLAGIGRSASITDETAVAQRLSDTLIAELKSADVVLIGAPMYNFGIASTLKTWFDYVIRAGHTFQYSASGPQGLVQSKPVVVFETRGGAYSENPTQSADCQEPHLRLMLGLMGLRDVDFLRVEGLALGEGPAKIAEGGRKAADLASLARYR